MRDSFENRLERLGEVAINEALNELLIDPAYSEAVIKLRPTICNAPHLSMCAVFRQRLLALSSNIDEIKTAASVQVAQTLLCDGKRIHHDYVIINGRYAVDGTYLQFSDLTPTEVGENGTKRVLVCDFEANIKSNLERAGIHPKYFELWKCMQDKERRTSLNPKTDFIR